MVTLQRLSSVATAVLLLSAIQVGVCHVVPQDLAVVVLLMLIPLLAPSETGHHGMAQIFKVQCPVMHIQEPAGLCTPSRQTIAAFAPKISINICANATQNTQHVTGWSRYRLAWQDPRTRVHRCTGAGLRGGQGGRLHRQHHRGRAGAAAAYLPAHQRAGQRRDLRRLHAAGGAGHVRHHAGRRPVARPWRLPGEQALLRQDAWCSLIV